MEHYQQKGGKELLSKTDDEEATPEGELEAIATPAMEERSQSYHGWKHS